MNRSPSKDLKVTRTGIEKKDGTKDHEKLEGNYSQPGAKASPVAPVTDGPTPSGNDDDKPRKKGGK